LQTSGNSSEAGDDKETGMFASLSADDGREFPFEHDEAVDDVKGIEPLSTLALSPT
jgi:hypothetical protein